MRSFIAHIFSISILAALIAGVLFRVDGLVTVVVAINWIIFALVIPVASALIAASVLYSKSEGEIREKIGKLLTNSARRRGVIAKGIGWITLLLTLGMLAWSGWIITAVIHVLASMILKFANSIARDEAVKQGLV